ncbi:MULTISPECIES: S8 family serine peptidase [unclassified Nocardioides]|uniref:S8 family serine peptidase n=1 Tax=unclassified Nocardioides TaxID=2615069 RepID=UPI0030143787
MRQHSSGSRRFVGLVSVGAVVAALLAAAPASAADGSDVGRTVAAGKPTTFKDGRYVVVLRDPSVAGYDGGTKGIPATKAAPGAAFRDDTSAARRYAAHLRTSQDALAKGVGAKVATSYTVATNGFSAELTGEQALALATDRRVLAVERDEARKLDTWNSPKFLGLTGKRGAWAAAGGMKRAGDGVVIADLDSGIWPESKSFSGRSLSKKPKTKWDISRDGTKTRMEKADGEVFTGECEKGEAWTVSLCNTKIISARYYPEAFLAETPAAEISPDESISTRDGDGHGTHTASTAAGNRVRHSKVEGRDFGPISGMAPAAKLAVYKVCWEDTDEDTGGCYNSAILSAIDDAVADGADILNFSISGATDTVLDVVELAFEGAAEAGVFVSASAGNSGPGASTVAHNSPWLTTVAATTHANLENTVRLGNGRRIVGASVVNRRIKGLRLISARDAGKAGVAAEDAALCGPNTLDPAKVKGTMVLCLRGVQARTAKSAEVKRSGGKAMILANPTEGSLDAEFHAVPTVHISHLDLPKVLRYLAADGPARARFDKGNTTRKKTPLPQVGGFSSRGPALANDSDILKPDISAPGVSVLAAVSPPSNQGRRFDLYSGTSMSAPHIAGLAAFVQGVKPRWTPMEIKSAMMTTATSARNAKGKKSSDWFGQGAGQVRPRKLLKPGLFVTTSGKDWRGFITGQGLDTGTPAIAAKDLNVPSMAKSGVTGKVSFVRTFRATSKGVWRVKGTVPGFKVRSSVKKVRSSRANDLIRVRFTFTRTSAPLDKWAKGAVRLSGPTEVRLPVALQPVAVTAPDLVTGSGVAGSADVPITAGTTGSVRVTTAGLTPAVVSTGSVATRATEYECVTVAPGTDRARFELDSADDTADLDMFLLSVSSCAQDPATAALVAEVATGSADEAVTLTGLPAGTYLAAVNGFSAGTAGSPMPYEVRYFGIGGVPDEGALTATPNPVPVTASKRTSFRLSWTGLTPATRYYGYLTYAGSKDPTYVSVVTP